MKSNSKHKAFALTKKGVALLITASLIATAMLFTACPNNSGGSDVPPAPGGSQESKAPFVEGGASLILSPDKLTIHVTVTTSDNSPITVEGCDKAELTSGRETELKAKNTGVVLKGKLTKLICYGNQLTALNVQGLSALNHLNCDNNKLTALNVQGLNALQSLSCSGNKLTALNVQGLNALQSLNCTSNQLSSLNVQGLNALQKLYCSNNQLTALNVQGLNALQHLSCDGNQLTADAFTKLFNDLPQRTVSQDANCRLYTEYSGVPEGNHKDFTSPGELKTAFDNAKTVKNWKMYKLNTTGHDVEI